MKRKLFDWYLKVESVAHTGSQILVDLLRVRFRNIWVMLIKAMDVDQW